MEDRLIRKRKPERERERKKTNKEAPTTPTVA
jgi:hypothetical protein